MNSQVYPFKKFARLAVRNRALRDAINKAATLQDSKRRGREPDLSDLDGLRTLAGRIKQHTIEHLDRYLDQFVDAATAAGSKVHFATTGEQAVETITSIVRQSGLTRVIKAKSMVSEEVELNDALERIAEVTETDLGEFIVQIDHDKPSHIVTPIIHKTAKDVAKSLQRVLGVEYTEDPTALTKHARVYLRERFHKGQIGISGANFGIAASGTVVLCTNEGNGRMCTSRPKVHIVLMGIEKLVPRLADLAVMLKLLGRSATGQVMTQYTSLITGPRKAGELDGPEEVHIVLIDRGRTRNLASRYRQTLRCIRCGACLNACPVYRNVGGHAYGSVYSGPIGSLLTPIYEGMKKFKDLPHATSLCGACDEACPVKIPLPMLFIRMRDEAIKTGITSIWERLIFAAWTLGLRWPLVYTMGQTLSGWFMRKIMANKAGWVNWMPGPPGAWTRKRPLPAMANKSFRSQWKQRLTRGR